MRRQAMLEGLMRMSLVARSACLCAMVAWPCSAVAELHFVTHMESHRVAGVKPGDPNTQKIAEAFVRVVLPEGPADTTYWVGENTMRVELSKRTGALPA